jgi:hypothetical protein
VTTTNEQHQGPLTEFLLERIAEDEAMAMAAPDDGEFAPGAGGLYWAHDFPGELGVERARVLAECDTKRHIVEIHREVAGSCGTCAEHLQDGWVNYERRCLDYPCPTLRAMALAYAGHPQLRTEWRA